MNSTSNTMRGRVLRALLPFLALAGDSASMHHGVTPLGTPPLVSPNRKLTSGAKQMSQHERGNRRKAKRRS